MVKHLLSFFICFYVILFMFGFEKAYADVKDYSLQQKVNLLNDKIDKHSHELLDICKDIVGMEKALRGSGVESDVRETIGRICMETRERLFAARILFDVYYLVQNNEDRSRMRPTMDAYIPYITGIIGKDEQYINEILTFSKNYNLILTGRRLKDKIAEIKEDMKTIRFE